MKTILFLAFLAITGLTTFNTNVLLKQLPAQAPLSIPCNNWLSTPSNPSYAEVGQINVSGNQITVEAVFNRTTPYSGGIMYAGDLVSKHNSPADANYLLRPNDAEITTSNGYFRTPDICEIELNKTYHVAMVYDGSTLKFYRNGFLMSQVAASGTLYQNNWKTRIGWYEPQGVNTNFIGFINEVRIWNVAKSQQQIRAYMSNSLPNPTTQSGLLAYYTFDNLTNKQGNTAYNATLGGSASINSTNNNCSFIADSCLAMPIPCNNWLNTPSVSSSVNIGELDVSGNQITVEAVINRTQPYLPGGGNNTEGDVVSKHNDFSDVNYLLRPNHAYITTTNGFFATPDVCDLQLNKTYHVAMVYDGSSLKFYRDGFLMSQIAASGNLIQNNWNTRIGHYDPAFWTTQFLGYINEVRIWNVARSQVQLNASMSSSLPNPATQPGLLAYYTFDNLVNKQGNTGFNAVINGAATINSTNPNCGFVPDSCNTSNSACQNNWLKMPRALSGVTVGDLDITGNKVTIEANCNATGDTTRALVSKHEDPRDVNYFLCPDLAQITTTNGFFSVTSTCPFQNNKTYHVALVYDGASLKLYRDGYIVGQTPASGNLITNDWPTTIGEYAYSMNYGFAGISNIFKGVINEVRIWNVARSQAELRTYMNASLPNPSTTPGLLAYYTFNNLLNKQGNAAYNGILRGGSTINNNNPNCNFIADSCDINTSACPDNWLKITDAYTGATAGDLDITGNQVTVEATCNGLGDLTRALVSKHCCPGDVNYFLCPDLAQINTTNGLFSAISSCSYINNKTYHVAMVYNGSSLKIYRNGYLLGQTAASGNLITNDWPLTFGENAYRLFAGLSTASNAFKGVINEVRIWNVARTQAELRAYMNTALPNPATQVGLRGYYVFDNLLNKQGNPAFNVSLSGTAVINASNPNCNFIADSCNIITPVTITNFTATTLNKSIQLNWHTEEESGITKYILQRSTSSSGPFLSVGEAVSKAGNSNTYTFTDNAVKANTTYYYRLYIIDISGSNKYSLVRNAIINDKNSGLTIYPNPTRGHFTISLALAEREINIRVMNAKGQLLLNKKTGNTSSNNIDLDISKFPTGNYWVEIRTRNSTITKKLLKL